jgi:hypothetical protein
VALADRNAARFWASDLPVTPEPCGRERALKSELERCAGTASAAQIESMRRAAHRLADLGLVYLEHEGSLFVGLEPRVPDASLGAI